MVKSKLNSILERANISELSARTRNKEKEMSPIRILRDDVPTSQVSEFKVNPLPIESRQELPPQTPPNFSLKKELDGLKKREATFEPKQTPTVTPIYRGTPLEVSKVNADPRSVTPTRARDLPMASDISRRIRERQEASPEVEEKYNFSLQNIDKIQQKIQSMLGKSKK